MNTIPNLGAYGYVAPIATPLPTQKWNTFIYFLIGTIVFTFISFVVYFIVKSTEKNDRDDNSSLPPPSKNFSDWMGDDLKRQF